MTPSLKKDDDRYMQFKLSIFLFIALLILIGGYFVVSSVKNPFIEPSVRVDTSRPSVIQEIKELQRLETAQFTLEKIIEAKTEGNVFQEVLYGDKILLIAHGKVIAGVDLSTLSEGDVTIEENKITLKLPAAEIFLTNLDESQTKVYDRTQGLLSKGNKDLETTARQQASDTIRKAACEGGILTEATDNAKKQLTALLQRFGFTQVDVITQVSTKGCI